MVERDGEGEKEKHHLSCERLYFRSQNELIHRVVEIVCWVGGMLGGCAVIFPNNHNNKFMLSSGEKDDMMKVLQFPLTNFVCI